MAFITELLGTSISTPTSTALGSWDQGRYQRPFLVSQIARIPQSLAQSCAAMLWLPHQRLLRIRRHLQNHNRLHRFNNFPDRLLEIQAVTVPEILYILPSDKSENGTMKFAVAFAVSLLVTSAMAAPVTNANAAIKIGCASIHAHLPGNDALKRLTVTTRPYCAATCGQRVSETRGRRIDRRWCPRGRDFPEDRRGAGFLFDQVTDQNADIPSTTNYVGEALMRVLFGLIAEIMIGIYLSASFPRQLHGILTLFGIRRG